MSERELNNKKVSTILQELTRFLELKGENPFKVRTYYNAAKSIETLDEHFGMMIREGRLKEIKGVCKDFLKRRKPI